MNSNKEMPKRSYSSKKMVHTNDRVLTVINGHKDYMLYTMKCSI